MNDLYFDKSRVWFKKIPDTRWIKFERCVNSNYINKDEYISQNNYRKSNFAFGTYEMLNF